MNLDRLLPRMIGFTLVSLLLVAVGIEVGLGWGVLLILGTAASVWLVIVCVARLVQRRNPRWWAVLADSAETLTPAAFQGAVAGLVAVLPLACIILFGLVGPGHGGPLEGTALEPVALAALCFCPILGVIAGAVVETCLVGLRLAKRVDQQSTYPEPVAGLDTEALLDVARPRGDPKARRKGAEELHELRKAEPREGEGDG